MKLTIPIKTLAAALKAVVPTVGRRSTLPILGGVMIDASGTRIAFEATDLEVSARITVQDGVDVLEDGRVVLPSKALAKAVSTMNGDVAELLADEGSHRATLRCGARVVTLDGFDPADWPRADPTEHVLVASAEAKVLADALIRVGLCASDDEARPPLTSIALFINDGSIQVVATDSYRMGVRHAYATMLLASGIHPKIASEALGHSTVGITLDTYSHVLPTMQAEAAAAIQKALGGLAHPSGPMPPEPSNVRPLLPNPAD